MGIDMRRILPVISCLGTVATGALSAWGALKMKEHEDSGKKKWLWMIPGALAGAGTMASIIATDKITTKELAILGGSAAYLSKKSKALTDKMKELGASKEEIKEVEREATRNAVREVYINGKCHTVINVEETGTGDLLCIEGYNGRCFRASKEHVDAAIRKFKAMYEIDKMSVCMNDLYSLLRLLETHAGYRDGWPAGDTYYEDMGGINIWAEMVTDPKDFNEPVYVIEIDMDTYPIECWMEY